MSIAEYSRFVTDARANPELAQEFKEKQLKTEAFLSLLAAKGYDVTEADLAEVKAKISERDGAELSDDELASTSGGFSDASLTVGDGGFSFNGGNSSPGESNWMLPFG